MFSDIRIYGAMSNVYTFKAKNLKGIDPELNDEAAALGAGESFFTAPQSKTYQLGVRLKF